jgi:hypothetical protein
MIAAIYGVLTLAAVWLLLRVAVSSELWSIE